MAWATTTPDNSSRSGSRPVAPNARTLVRISPTRSYDSVRLDPDGPATKPESGGHLHPWLNLQLASMTPRGSLSEDAHSVSHPPVRTGRTSLSHNKPCDSSPMVRPRSTTTRSSFAAQKARSRHSRRTPFSHWHADKAGPTPAGPGQTLFPIRLTDIQGTTRIYPPTL